MRPKRTALVTGGSRGIGRACALRLAEDGWSVVVAYRSDANAAASVIEEIASRGGEAASYRADVTSEDDVRALFRILRSDHLPLGAVISNAGLTRDGLAPMMSLGTWEEVILGNLTSAFLVSRESLKAMRRTGGSLVLMSSVSGLRGQPGQANYSASKGGLNALTRTLAREAAVSGIRVNAVAPGFTDTDMVRKMPPNSLERLIALIPQGRLGDASEVAALVSFLAGTGSSYLTGQVIAVDGGLSA